MVRTLATRLISLVPILFGTSLVAFLLIRLVPGDPAIALLGLEADAQRDLWGLDSAPKSRPEAVAAPGAHVSIGA